ncbi:oligopeptide ABC transporter substrate-binding protein [Salisediminibacterium beveridgei]|uniref:Oligopeptide ABC transporter, periplasmic oligopeptide-binding protein AppA/OppA n=1 Tax=Salisediminibacterium beveridgei TaxID=632773 RepID=A0A1D7R070_9BACI|nr:oligopeptide ABC transporter substrate-binding protein [Salisediminibacterium beveridgei]AOM84657.1 Oligopeptide ABC transporter, periplasmic oligopeptide-binding protein AppA/OppA [Salisediminibacterium beveridgei]
MKKSRLVLPAALLSTTMVVAACGGNDNNGNNNDVDPGNDNNDNTEMNDDNDNNNNDDEAAEGDAPQGGTVTYGYTSPFAGLLDWAWYEGQDDSLALSLFNGEGLYEVRSENDFDLEPSLAHDWEWSDDNTTITFHLEEGVMWHDGEELTASDFKFSYETIAHPDGNTARQTNVDRIVGYEDYRAGEADELAGVEVIDDYTFSVEFNEVAANNLANLWSYPMSENHLGHLEVSEMEDADEIRRNPVGLGAFVVDNVVPGEMIEYSAFEDYWKGEPNLDGVVYRIVDGDLAGELLAQGEVDIIELTAGQAGPLEGDDTVTLEEIEALSYSYIGFKLGHWDEEEGTAVMDNEKFASKEVRHAFAHAIDRQGIIDAFSEGYGTVINAPESVIRWSYPDESQLNQFEYDTERAQELLAEAGYEDVTGDGFVEDPDGEEFTVNFAAMNAPADIAEPRAQYIIQNLQDAGINAQLMDGQLYDFNLFYDLVEEDDPDIDIFLGAWGLATADPDLSGLWLSTDFWNFSRWVNEESDQLIRDGVSEEALDFEYRQEVYQEWHQLFNEELPMIPLSSPVNIYGVSADVGGVTPEVRDATPDPHLWYREQ